MVWPITGEILRTRTGQVNESWRGNAALLHNGSHQAKGEPAALLSVITALKTLRPIVPKGRPIHHDLVAALGECAEPICLLCGIRDKVLRERTIAVLGVRALRDKIKPVLRSRILAASVELDRRVELYRNGVFRIAKVISPRRLHGDCPCAIRYQVSTVAKNICPDFPGSLFKPLSLPILNHRLEQNAF